MSEPVFLIALGIAGTTLVLVAGAIAGAIRGRGSSRSGVTQLSDELKDHAAALEDLQNTLASQFEAGKLGSGGSAGGRVSSEEC
jgi:hypothetical protein